MVGPSRKRFIGEAAGGLPAEARLPGTIAACVVALMHGARLFRVHDVAQARAAWTSPPPPAGGQALMGALISFLPGPLDLLQILVVAAAFYYVLKLLARTRAIQMLAGLLVLSLTYFLARLFNLALIRHILEQLLQYGAIAAIIVFHPELRAALARLGQSRMIKFFNRMEEREVVEELVEAVERLTRAKDRRHHRRPARRRTR
jgi:hypothetical protein